MEEDRQDRDLDKAEVNKDPEGTTDRRTRHTWIGDADEIRPDFRERTVTRMTYPGTEAGSTRIVERERKPYRGFITDEEVRHAEAAAEIDRRASAERRAAMEEMAQTRVYSGFGSGLDADEPKAAEPEDKQVNKRVRTTYNVRIADSSKFKRLIALACVLVLLVLFELSFVVMKAQTASLPAKTSQLKSQTEELTKENESLKSQADAIGDYDQVKELRDSWQRTKEKITDSE